MAKIVFRHLELEKELVWDEAQHLNELVIESPRLLRALLQDLAPNEGSVPKLCFSKEGKTLNIQNDLDVIFNPMELNFSNRRTTAALLKILGRTAVSEDFYLRTAEVKAQLVRYLNELTDANQFTFEVVVDDDFSAEDLAKAVKMRIVGNEEDYVETLVDYMSMLTELVGIQLFVVLNLRLLLADDELLHLRHALDNHQLNVLLIEARDNGALEGVSRLLVDRDDCEL